MQMYKFTLLAKSKGLLAKSVPDKKVNNATRYKSWYKRILAQLDSILVQVKRYWSVS